MSSLGFHLSLEYRNIGCGPNLSKGQSTRCRLTISLKVLMTLEIGQSIEGQWRFFKPMHDINTPFFKTSWKFWKTQPIVSCKITKSSRPTFFNSWQPLMKKFLVQK